MTVTLEALVAAARQTMERDRRVLTGRELEARLRDSEVLRLPAGRLRAALERPGMGVIAEIKGASPVAGTLRRAVDPVALARGYEEAGAVAVSVLTEEQHFGGSLERLRQVAGAVSLPVLRKDFVIDPYQVRQAALAGASAVLLIAEALEPERLRDLVELAHELRMDALVEIHGVASLPAAADAGSGILAVNSRNLETMAVDWEHCLRVAGDLPAGVCRVAESGVHASAQVRALGAAGYHAVLVGTSLMTAPDPGAALRELLAGGR